LGNSGEAIVYAEQSADALVTTRKYEGGPPSYSSAVVPGSLDLMYIKTDIIFA